MESTNKNKQLNLTTFTVDTLIFIFALLSVVGLLYSTSFSDVQTPYKPTKSSPDPLLPALNISISRLQNMSSLLETLISKSKNPLTLDSLRTCNFLLKVLAVRNLNKSLDLLTKGPGDDDLLFTRTLDDGISDAILEHKMCLYFLEGLQVLDEMRLHTLKKFTDGNVAVLEKISPLLEKHRFRACLFNHICLTI